MSYLLDFDVRIIPDSWLRLTLGEVIDYGKAEKVEPSEIPVDAWVLELEDVEKDTSKLLQRLTFAQRQSKSTKNKFSMDDVLYGKLRPYLNKILIADCDGYCSTEILPLKPNQSINGHFLFYWLKHPAFLDYVEDVSHGLNMPRLGTEAGKQAPFVLAPLNEQKRIADKLDRLLTRVDACREKCDRIPLILKRFRQSVLTAATSGELTENWREANPNIKSNLVESISTEPTGDFQNVIESANYSLPDTWIWLTPDLIKANERYSLSIGPFGSNLITKDYKESGVPLVFVREIRARSFGDKKTKFVSKEKAQELWAHRVEPGDLLITKMGDPPGDTAIFPLNRPTSIITSDCIRIKPNPEIANIKLLSLFIESNLIRLFMQEITAGVAQQKISLQRFRSMPIPIPPLEEQEEIVRLFGI